MAFSRKGRKCSSLTSLKGRRLREGKLGSDFAVASTLFHKQGEYHSTNMD